MSRKQGERVDKIMRELANHPEGLSAYQIQTLTGISTFRLWPTLLGMELVGNATSAWVEGPYPRCRLYYATRLNDGQSSND